jgi:hypothetical protein
MLPNNSDIQGRVSEYISPGLAAIPIKHKSKQPVSSGWPKLRLPHDYIPTYFNCHVTNIGD